MPLGQGVLSDLDKLLGKADAGTNNALQKFLNWVSASGPQVIGIVKNLGIALSNVGKSFFGLGSKDIGLFAALASLIATISKNPVGAAALTGLLVLSKVGQMFGPIAKLAIAFKELSAAIDLTKVASIGLDAVPIVLVIAGIIAVTILLVQHWGTVKKVAVDVWHHVWDAIKDVWNWIKAHWPLLLAILLGPIAVATYEIVTHWHQIENGAKRMFDNVIGFFKSLPRRILNALGDLGSLLWNAGISILSGLLGGLLQKWNDVTHFISGIGSWIAAHKGPIDVDAVLLRPTALKFRDF